MSKSGAAPATVSELSRITSHCVLTREGDSLRSLSPLVSPETGLKLLVGIAEGNAAADRSYFLPVSV